MQPNRLGLGLRPPLPSYGQGPSISALAQQQQQQQQQQQINAQGFVPPQAQKQISLFVGSISGGITDNFLNDLLTVRFPPLLPLLLTEKNTTGLRECQVFQAVDHTRK
jgi:RNA-binding protein 25